MKQPELFKEIKMTDLEKEVRRLFPINYFTIGEVLFGGKLPIVIVRFSEIDALRKNWKELNSFLAAEYMTSIKDEYAKWNFYIFYYSIDSVEKQLKYEIENNKFSSRKIVIDSFQRDISNVDIKEIISEHITNDNIELTLEQEKIKPFKKNALLSKSIDKFTLSKTKKNNDDELSNILDKIENTFKDEI